MLRPPLQSLYDRKRRTFLTATMLTVALVIPVVLALAATTTFSIARQKLDNFRPIIYLTTDASADAAEQLRSEISQWSSVAKVTQRSPADALQQLETRLGPEHIRDLGLTKEMLPNSLILEPTIPLAGHIQLIARVAGLEARMEVDSVEIPSASALKTLRLTGLATAATCFLLLMFTLSALNALAGFLRTLEHHERHELAILEIFGADDSALRRPSLLRGITIGIWSGIAATTLTGLALIIWQNDLALALGQLKIFTATSFLLLAAPLLIGPILGLLAGLIVTRRKIHPGNSAVLRPLLRWRGSR